MTMINEQLYSTSSKVQIYGRFRLIVSQLRKLAATITTICKSLEVYFMYFAVSVYVFIFLIIIEPSRLSSLIFIII